jgi:hypothetical protein
MGFKDDYPLNPPPMPTEWSEPIDRRPHESVDEVRRYLQELQALLEGLYRAEVRLPDGRVVTTLIRESGRDDRYLGFEVYRASGTTVSVWPSVISGMGTVGVPVMSGISLANDPPPELSISSGSERWVALRAEVDPDAELIPALPVAEGEPVPDPVYRILEGGGSLTTGTSVEVRSYADEDAMAAATRLPLINTADGTVIQSGIYVIPLAKVFSDGRIEQLGYRGPIGIRMCASGAAVILGPAVAVMIQS